MQFDFAFDDSLEIAATTGRRLNYQAGLAAENCVLRRYLSRSAEMLARRWRGQAGKLTSYFSRARVPYASTSRKPPPAKRQRND